MRPANQNPRSTIAKSLGLHGNIPVYEAENLPVKVRRAFCGDDGVHRAFASLGVLAMCNMLIEEYQCSKDYSIHSPHSLTS